MFAAVLDIVEGVVGKYFGVMLRFISEGNTVPNIEAELENIGQTADELCHRLYIECRAQDVRELPAACCQ